MTSTIQVVSLSNDNLDDSINYSIGVSFSNDNLDDSINYSIPLAYEFFN